jgi:DNA-binding NarL/FixJ family response regulator
MNGIELTEHIKTRFGKEVVVIMISAAEWEAIEEDAKKAGVDGFIPKPLFPSILTDCINSCIKNMREFGGEKAEGEQEDRFRATPFCWRKMWRSTGKSLFPFWKIRASPSTAP